LLSFFVKATWFKLVCWFRSWRRLIACWSVGFGTVLGRSPIHSWDGPNSWAVRYSFKPRFAALALFLSSSATSVFRHMPVYPFLGIFHHLTFYGGYPFREGLPARSSRFDLSFGRIFTSSFFSKLFAQA